MENRINQNCNCNYQNGNIKKTIELEENKRIISTRWGKIKNGKKEKDE